MGGSLFWKIYLTLIAGLVVVALAAASFFWLSNDDEDRGWQGKRDAFLAAMLPEGEDPRQTELIIERLAEAFDADISIFGANAVPLLVFGSALDFLDPADRRRFRSGEETRFSARLPGDRVLVARFEKPFGPSRASPLGGLALIAVVTGLVAWPVVRHLTRRLEKLRRGVEEWGEGNLARRVDIEGRDEVAAVAANFNLAAERIERLVAAHRSLLANASHELRSPLARLRMAIDLYEEAPRQELKLEIVRNLSELDTLVEEILLASRLEHGGNENRFDRVEMLALVTEEAARHGIAATGMPATMLGDARLLARLVRNLIQNAERHGAPPVEVDMRRDGERLLLTVRDHGHGIAEDDTGRVFEPFYRPAGHGETSGGWGLGLALVRQIAIRHSGEVRHETPLEGGTRFVVSLPGDAGAASETAPERAV